jgi:hypothetical protein
MQVVIHKEEILSPVLRSFFAQLAVLSLKDDVWSIFAMLLPSLESVSRSYEIPDQQHPKALVHIHEGNLSVFYQDCLHGRRLDCRASSYPNMAFRSVADEIREASHDDKSYHNNRAENGCNVICWTTRLFGNKISRDREHPAGC